jgi:hypothetical protein
MRKTGFAACITVSAGLWMIVVINWMFISPMLNNRQQKYPSQQHPITDHQSLQQDQQVQHQYNQLQITENITAVSVKNDLSCESIPAMIAGKLRNAQINTLRRKLMLEDLKCFHAHATLFIDIFQSRSLANHVMLHIPKAGGTSVCASVKREGILTTIGGNCWKDDFCPIWCGCEEPQPTTCATINRWSENFVMNENWLDYFCDHHTYSILIREPVARTMSHINHFLNAVVSRRGDHFYGTTNWRSSLIQANYMTWALTAYTADETQHPKLFQPRQEHIPIARSRLMKMDYIVDLSNPDETCRHLLLHYMRIESELDNSNSAHSNYTEGFRRSDIAALNELDMQVYTFAKSLLEIDCRFLSMVHNRE